MRGYLRPPALSLKRLLLAAIGGVASIGSSVALFGSFQYTTIGTATIVYHVQPFLIIVIGVLVFKERVRPVEIFWMFVAFGGLVFSTGLVRAAGSADGDQFVGIALSLVAAILYAAGTMIGKCLGKQQPEVTTLVQAIVGVILLVPFVHVSQPLPLASWKWLAALGVIHTGIAYVLMFSAYPQFHTTIIGVLGFIFPLVSILVDRLAFEEKLQTAQGRPDIDNIRHPRRSDDTAPALPPKR
jgi:drug/metabolite transporter (DMT)-like permease